MHRFFALPEQFKDGKVFLDKEEAYHLKKVLRLRPKDIIYVFDGQGHEYKVQLTVIENSRIWGQVITEVQVFTEPKLKVTLAQGLAKKEKNELVVQKATEIGVQTLIPMICERSISRPSAGNKKADRFRRIAREAAKQCRRAVVPTVEPMATFGELLDRFSAFDAVLFLWEEERSTDIKQILQQLKQNLQPKTLLVLVGPEGGFSLTEAKSAREHGALTMSLGPRILRTETAGLVALSAIFYEFDELKSL